MQNKNYSFSKDFIAKIIELTGGLVPSDLFEKMLLSLEYESIKYFFTRSSESNLLRIINSVYDKASFLIELSKYPHHSECVIAIAASSNYLTDIVVRNPEFLYQLFDQSYLSKKIEIESLQNEISFFINKFKSLPAKLNYLRQLKKRYILKIGIADLLRLDNLQSTTQQISSLARSINAELFELCYKETLKKYNLVIKKPKYCFCALGKLGGNELNYSSDVDLLLFYDENIDLPTIKKEYHEILSEATLLFIKCSTEISGRGYIYRIDFRLRPDGKYSPLCQTLKDYINHYETRGEDWERQMLIKLDFICGDKVIYNKFYNFLRPFIFPSSFSSSLKNQIKQMKASIELHNKEVENVKLFSGGIRDIEFAVQALQLLNGGKHKDLRTANTLEAISLLQGKGLLKVEEKEILNESYILFRRIEHFLQLMNDTQTHTIPSEGELLQKLSNYLGFPTPFDLKYRLNELRKKVRRIYDNILFTRDKKKVELESHIKFQDSNRADKNLKYLRSGIGIFDQKEFDTRTTNLFTQIEQVLFKYLREACSPDRALENFTKVIRTEKFPSIWYREFADRKFFKDFLQICEFSSKAIDLITIDETIGEFFLSRKPYIKKIDREFVELNINQLIFMLSAQYALRLITPEKISIILCNYIGKIINRICFKLGFDYNYFIGGLGSFGSLSLNFSSDIDLIVVADDIEKHPDIQKDFQKLLSLIQQELKPFVVDFRLRPEGKSSPLVSGIDNYNNYLATRARVWEFQSLQKIRFVAGDKGLFNEFKKSLTKQVKKLNPTIVKNEIKNMYDAIQKEIILPNNGSFNMKKQEGGLLTIDFIIQSYILSDSKKFKRSIGKSTAKILYELVKNKKGKDFERLLENLNFLRNVEFAIQNIFNLNNTVIDTSKEKKLLIASFLKMKNEKYFSEQLSGIIKFNNNVYKSYVG